MVQQASSQEQQQFVEMVQAFINPQTEIRKRAEDLLEKTRKADANRLVHLVFQVLEDTSIDEDVRFQTAVLIRHIFQRPVKFGKDETDNKTDKQVPIWNLLSAEIRFYVRAKLLESIVVEKNKKIRANICDSLADIACKLLSDSGNKYQLDNPTDTNAWPNLFNDLLNLAANCRAINFQTLQGENDILNGVVSALKILSELSLSNAISESIYQNVRILVEMFELTLSCPNIDIRYEAFNFLSNSLDEAPPEVLNGFSPLAKICINCLLEVAEEAKKANDFTNLSKFLEVHAYLMESCPGFLKNQMLVYADLCVQIALIDPNVCDNMDEYSEEFSKLEQCRKYAIEILITYVEKKPISAFKQGGFVRKLIEILMVIMLDITSPRYKEWLSDGQDEDSDVGNRLFDFCENAMDRLVRAYSGENRSNVMKWVFEQASIFSNKSAAEANSSVNWAYKFVAIMTISQTVEYVSEDELDYQISELVTMLVREMKNHDYRVRFAACQAIGQMSLDHPPYLQDNFDNTIIPVLIEAFDDPAQRVKAHACAAFINFIEEVDELALIPYADVVMKKSLEFITYSEGKLLREYAVTTIAVIAGVLEDKFSPYYDSTMTLMKKIMLNCHKSENKVCLGKAIECMSIICFSLPKEKIAEDAKFCVDQIIRLQKEKVMENDELLTDYIHESITRFARSLGDQFVEYLPALVPNVLKVFTECPLVMDVDSMNDSDEVNEGTDMTYALIQDGERVGLKTSLIDDQIRALNEISVYAEICKGQFYQYVRHIAQSIVPILTYQISEDLMEETLDALSKLILCTRCVIDEKIAQNIPISNIQEIVTLKEILMYTANSVFATLGSDDAGDFVEVLAVEAAGLNACFQEAKGDILDAATIQISAKNVFTHLKNSNNRRAALASKKNADLLDEDEKNDVELNESQEQEFRTSLLDIIGALMKYYPSEFCENNYDDAVNFVLECFSENNRKDINTDDICIGLYICCDILEHLKQHSKNMWNAFSYRLIACLNLEVFGKKYDVLQAASYAICKAAELPFFEPHVPVVTPKIVAIIEELKSSKKETIQCACDNAVTTLGTILMKYSNPNSNFNARDESYFNLWLCYLPLKADLAEAKKAHGQLLDFVENDHPLALRHPENRHNIIRAMALIYKHPSNEEEINRRVLKLFAQFDADIIPKYIEAFGHMRKVVKNLNKIAKDIAEEKQKAGI